MAEHRVSMLGGPLRRYDDPARSRDPRIREIVTALATLEPAPAPRAHFRAELRAQLVAVAPRLVVEGAAEQASAANAVARTADEPDKNVGRGLLSGIRLGRPLAAVACAVVVLAMVLGGAVFMSKNALPGEALYPIKRASENAEYALAQSPSERARLNLTFAGNRLQEVQSLLPSGHGVASVSPHVASLVDSTLSSADSDVIKAAQTLGEQAVQDNSAQALQPMTSWAPNELNRLANILGRLPAGPVRDHAQATYALVTNAVARANALQAEAGCSCLRSAPSDQLGPIPCPVCDASPNPTTPTQPGGVTVPGITTPTSTGSSASGAGNTNVSPNGSGQTNSSSTSGSSPNTAQTSHPTLPLPSVPLTVPSLSVGPVGVGSCGISISLSPINLHLGSCAPPHS